VVAAGLAVTLAPVVADSPVEGDHVNEVPVPVAVSVDAGSAVQRVKLLPALTVG